MTATLACIRYQRDQQRNDREYSWQSFQFSRFNADNALKSVKSEIDAFEIDNSEYPAKAVSPNGDEFYCSSYYYD